MTDGFERLLKIHPGFDRIDPDPKKNYGIKGCDIRFILIGPLGAISLLLYTDWYPAGTQERLWHQPRGSYFNPQPSGSDIGYHSPQPRADWQKEYERKCDILPGGTCYGDSSALQAEEYRDILLEKGSDGVWEKMIEYYGEVFASDEPPLGLDGMMAGLSQALKDAKDE